MPPKNKFNFASYENSDGSFNSTNLVYGDKGDLVCELQDFLKENGSPVSSNEKGLFGDETADALLKLQNENKFTDYVNHEGDASSLEKYKVGNKVKILTGAPFFDSAFSTEKLGNVHHSIDGVIQYIRPETENPIGVWIKSEDHPIASFEQNSGQSVFYFKSVSILVDKKAVAITEKTWDMVHSLSSENSQKGIDNVNAKNNINQIVTLIGEKKLPEAINPYKNKNGVVSTRGVSHKEIRRKSRKISGLGETNNGMFIRDLTLGTTILLPFNPGSISDDVHANFESESIRGATRSFDGYEGTGDRTISFSFAVDIGALQYYQIELLNTSSGQNVGDLGDHVRSLISEDRGGDGLKARYYLDGKGRLNVDPYQLFQDYINALKALSYPKYNGNMLTPPMCYVSLANNVRFVGTCKSVGITHNGPLYYPSYKRTDKNDKIYVNRISNNMDDSSREQQKDNGLFNASGQLFGKCDVSLSFDVVSAKNLSDTEVFISGNNTYVKDF